ADVSGLGWAFCWAGWSSAQAEGISGTAVVPSSAPSAIRAEAEASGNRMTSLPGYPSPARQRASARSVASAPGRSDLRDLTAALERIGDEARRLHLLNELGEIGRARGTALRRAHRLLDLQERPAHHPHFRMIMRVDFMRLPNACNGIELVVNEQLDVRVPTADGRLDDHGDLPRR